ncbi:MAG: AMP-dependent synthetase/ligase [Muribaculaceae bacterium]
MNNILTTLIERQCSRYGDRTAIYERRDGRWQPLTWDTLRERSANVAYALETLGLPETGMTAIFSANCPEFLISDFAAYANRAVPVSIYATSSADQVKYIINDSRASIIYVGDRKQLDIVLSVIPDCKSLRHIIVIDRNVNIGDGLSPDGTVNIMTFEALEGLGAAASQACRRAVAERTAAASPDDIATLIYTSGTTGEPKGAVLPHSCFNACLRLHHERLTSLSDEDTSICFLPLSHIFEKAWTYFCLDAGIRVYVNEDPKVIQESLAETHPTCMCSVPRFWEKVHTAVRDQIQHMSWFKRLMVRRALHVGHRRNIDYRRLGLKVPKVLEWEYEFYDKRVFRLLRRAIGFTNPNIFPTAGAPLSAGIVEFFQTCGLNIMIGYGLSETTATVTCFPYTGWEPGTVGTLLPEIKCRIGEDNEIQVKGPTVMREYYNKPAETEAAFTDDGWFRTGDAGYFDARGDLVLTERIKDLFKTSNGKYIAPQVLESRLGEDRYIEQVAIIGDQRKYVSAIVVPAFAALREYARKKKIAFRTNADLIRNKDIRSLIEARIEKLQADRAGFEKIKRFTLLPHEFTIQAGELTNTLKLRRPVINRNYAAQIEAMYV